MQRIAYPDNLPSSVGGWRVRALEAAWHSPLGSDDTFFVPWGQEAKFILFEDGVKFVVQYPVLDKDVHSAREWYGGVDEGRRFLNRLKTGEAGSSYKVLDQNGEAAFSRWLTPRFLRRCRDRLGIEISRWGNIYTAPLTCFDEVRRNLRLTHGIEITLRPAKQFQLAHPFAHGCTFSGHLNKVPKFLNAETCYFGHGTLFKKKRALCSLPRLPEGEFVIMHSPIWTDVVPGF